MTPEVVLTPPGEGVIPVSDAASLPAQAEPGKASQGSVTCDPQPLDDEYRAPIPGSTEEKVYRQYYLPFCARVGVKPAPFLRWLALSEAVGKSSVEILDWGAPGRLRGNPAQPSWIPGHEVERFLQTNTASTVALMEESTALPSDPKEVIPEVHTANQRIGTFAAADTAATIGRDD